MCAAPTFPWTDLRSESVETDFRSIFERCPLPVARCDHRGIILQMNSAFEQILKPENGSGGTLRVTDVVASENHENTDHLVREVLEGTHSAAHVERGKANRGWTIWRLGGEGKQSYGALLLAQPNLDNLASKHLLQAERWETVGRLTGGVVHDFNNLLTGVMLYCDLLLSSLDTSEGRMRRYAEEIRGAVAHASVLIRQLLVFARPGSGLNDSVRPVVLNQVAETMQSLLARLIGENIELALHLDSGLGLVEIDWAQAEQILLNLILNARDALPEGGRIVVETSKCKLEPVNNTKLAGASAFPCVLLTVSDNGLGMDAATRRRVFEPFYTTKATGTGLGLATTFSIVRGNSGLIHVESELGRGTRVMILLPQSSPLPNQPISNQPLSDLAVSNPPHLAVATSDSPRTTLREVKKEPHL
jgi:two-component system, cell cycle sensor histidine kinase and response regulator CckA